MNRRPISTKETGDKGEDAAVEYLKEQRFKIVARNVARKTGEIDIIAEKGGVLHFVEVKTVSCRAFPNEDSSTDSYDPSVNLHQYKIHKIARTAQWYVAEKEWEGEWQVDGILVWLRVLDGKVYIEYLPQIL